MWFGYFKWIASAVTFGQLPSVSLPYSFFFWALFLSVYGSRRRIDLCQVKTSGHRSCRTGLPGYNAGSRPLRPCVLLAAWVFCHSNSGSARSEIFPWTWYVLFHLIIGIVYCFFKDYFAFLLLIFVATIDACIDHWTSANGAFFHILWLQINWKFYAICHYLLSTAM